MIKCINIKIVSPTANMKHTGYMARSLQLALPEGVVYFLNIESHILGTRSKVLQPQFWAAKARDMEL